HAHVASHLQSHEGFMKSIHTEVQQLREKGDAQDVQRVLQHAHTLRKKGEMHTGATSSASGSMLNDLVPMMESTLGTSYSGPLNIRGQGPLDPSVRISGKHSLNSIYSNMDVRRKAHRGVLKGF
ncbi:MAG: hypothetical protein AAFO91_00500, partial [Bacteroidota bacterium]